MAAFTQEALTNLPRLQEQRFLNPHIDWYKDYQAVYEKGEIFVGWPLDSIPRDAHLARENTAVIVGIALGDEGKGRITDNIIRELLSVKGIEIAYVSRDNGGGGSGHTIQNEKVKLALNQVPSGVFYPEVIGIMDRGMAIHPEDLMHEIILIEEKVGDTRGKLIVSEGAVLQTDLDRVEELLNNIKQSKSGGGTKRGMAPSYAHELDRLGEHIYDLLDNNWKEKLGKKYDRYKKEFKVYGLNLQDIDVIDYKVTKSQKKQIYRKLGDKKEYLDRIEQARNWMLERKMIKNTYLIHRKNMTDPKIAYAIEKAQAVNLDPILGTYPDIATSDTTADGIKRGTGIWKVEQIKNRIGVMKITYTSSVGKRIMPTHIPLGSEVKKEADLGSAATAIQRRGAWIRDIAKEEGTTSQRSRDILEVISKP